MLWAGMAQANAYTNGKFNQASRIAKIGPHLLVWLHLPWSSIPTFKKQISARLR
jgi:hypothetical protein